MPTTVTCDSTSLVAAAACYECQIPPGMQMAVLIWLMCQIANSVSSGALTQLVTYTSGTPANPANTANPAIAYDPTGNLPILGWNTTTLTWN